MLPVGVSNSLGKLRALRDSFAAPGGEKRALRLVDELGRTAVPLLCRTLRAGDRDDAERAYRLLARIGGERVVVEARALACDPAAAGDARALALALLAQLGAEPPPDVAVEDVEALRDASVRDLVGALGEPADVARAADLIVEEVPAAELAGFVGDLVEAGGSDVAPIVDELLLRDDVPAEAAARLRELRGRLGEEPPVLASPGGKRRMWTAERDDGARAVLVVQRIPGRRPARLRALTSIVDGGGRLASVRYEPELPPRAGLRRMLHAVVAAGFVPSPVRSAAEAADLVAEAARATRPLPRGYYLGRDLLGLTDEHAGERRRAGSREPLERASRLIERGQPTRAEPLLRRFVEEAPDDADGRALLAYCLLQIGDEPRVLEAITHLTATCRLEPHEAIHQWNLAHAAKRAGRLGACYLALRRYLEAADDEEGGAGRVRAARSYLKLFEKYARLEHPETTVERVARAEELFERAYQHLSGGRVAEAVSGFEAVLKLVPSHYPSWANLGVAHASLSRRDEAERCLRRALSYRPDYDVALRNLEALVVE